MNTHFWGINSTPAVEIRTGTDGGKTLMGYAAMFDSLSEDLGGFREIIRKGAFDATLASKPDVSARIQHAGGLNTIGRTTNGTLRLGVDKKGLKYEVDLPDTTAARDIHALVKRGDINKSSFAFSLRYDGDTQPERWTFESDPIIRELLNVNLHDVAPVDGPAYDATSVSARAFTEAKAKAPDPVELAKRAQDEREAYFKQVRERIAVLRTRL